MPRHQDEAIRVAAASGEVWVGKPGHGEHFRGKYQELPSVFSRPVSDTDEPDAKGRGVDGVTTRVDCPGGVGSLSCEDRRRLAGKKPCCGISGDGARGAEYDQAMAGTATKLGLLRLFFSSRTPTWAKWLFGLLALAYLASPWDAIPDIVLGPGFIDDLVMVPLLLWLATRFATNVGGSEKAEASPGRKTVKNEAERKRGQGEPVGERSDGMRREA